MANPQATSTDDAARYAPLYLDAYLERYGFTLARLGTGVDEQRWLTHGACGWHREVSDRLPVRVIFNLAAAHLSQECEPADQSE